MTVKKINFKHFKRETYGDNKYLDYNHVNLMAFIKMKFLPKSKTTEKQILFQGMRTRDKHCKILVKASTQLQHMFSTRKTPKDKNLHFQHNINL